MPGFSDYIAKSILNTITGQIAFPALPAVYLGLLTTAPTSDSGSGAVEVSGGSYARVQVAGTAATNGATTTASNTLHFAATPSWIQNWIQAAGGSANPSGLEVYDVTTGQPVGIVSSATGTTVVLQANASNAVGNGDTLSFSAFSNASGSSPASITTNIGIVFPTPTGNWGTVVAFALYDAASSGNLLNWDYLGNFSWLPVYITNASPGVFDAKGNTYANGDSIVYYTEYGGTAPSGITAGNTLQTVAGLSGDTFNIGINTTSTGSGMVRKVASQVISTNVVAYYAAGTLTLSAT